MLKIAYSKCYSHPLPAGHRFPMEKYEILPGQLIYEGIVDSANFFEPKALDKKWILNTHSSAYWDKLQNLTLSKSEIRMTGFPLSKALVDREIIIAGGSVQAAHFAIEYGIAMNIAGGTHHAFYAHGEGFCLLNDIAITANYLIDNRLASKILVIDLDVHQGNGTAALFPNSKDVFTFSMHGEKNYPHRKEQSSLDSPLPDGIKDGAYLNLLAKNLELINSKISPEFIIYQCGVDVLESDKLGRLGLTISGVRERDLMILNYARQFKAPILCCMGGGYSPQVSKIVDAHTQVYRLAQELFF
ncbi:MAG: acetoin utilization deacetylase AcuC-like enzyme [Algoriphagus sp.]|jgi:acetoin utilization deacetylase AcuC-like enzyme